jgi:hypothetical protein
VSRRVFFVFPFEYVGGNGGIVLWMNVQRDDFQIGLELSFEDPVDGTRTGKQFK